MYSGESGTFSYGPNLPSTALNNDYSCSARISDEISFYADDFAYLYNWSTEEFLPTANAKPQRSYEASCGYAESSNGDRMVVVAGGYPATPLVQIYDLNEGTWNTVDSVLPYPLYFATAVPFGNTFLVVGGENAQNEFEDRILQLLDHQAGEAEDGTAVSVCSYGRRRSGQLCIGGKVFFFWFAATYLE